MKEIDLMSIGSYTELPGGNIALPQGYSSVLAPIIKNIPSENILKQHPITSIQSGLTNISALSAPTWAAVELRQRDPRGRGWF